MPIPAGRLPSPRYCMPPHLSVIAQNLTFEAQLPSLGPWPLNSSLPTPLRPPLPSPGRARRPAVSNRAPLQKSGYDLHQDARSLTRARARIAHSQSAGIALLPNSAGQPAHRRSVAPVSSFPDSFCQHHLCPLANLPKELCILSCSPPLGASSSDAAARRAPPPP